MGRKEVAVTRADLKGAVERGVISEDQAAKLWDAWSKRGVATKLHHFIYYLGALLIVFAMSWFLTVGWEWGGGAGIFLIGLAYGILFFVSGYFLWKKESLKIPGGLLVTLGVCMTPLVIFGLEKYMGVSGNRGSTFLMEIGTVIVGLVALWFVRFPFLTAPIALALWYMSIDLTPLLFGEGNVVTQGAWVSLLFGIVLLACSYLIDRRTKEDFAFWGYLFGTAAFWGGLSLLTYSSEFNWVLYLFINILLMIASILLDRVVLMVFGAFGVFCYLEHLASKVFAHSLAYPFVLTLLGLAIIGLGIFYQKKSLLIHTTLHRLVPKSLQKFLPKNRR